VYLPPEPLESVLPFINLTNRDTAVPIFVYGPDLTRVLYIFNSKTSFYSEFNMHRITLEDYLNKENKLYNYFTFSSNIFDGSDLDNLLSLNELIELKNSVNPKIPSRGKQVRLKDLVLDKELNFNSLSQASLYIKKIEGACDRGVLRNHMNNNTIYKRR
jgi:hypothetical protein